MDNGERLLSIVNRLEFKINKSIYSNRVPLWFYWGT